MGLISTLKELLGMETQERPQRHDVEVTVERETDAGSERAVKEPVASATSSEDAAEGTATAATTDATAASETETAETAESAATEEANTAATAESETEDAETAETEPEATAAAATADEATGTAEPETESTEAAETESPDEGGEADEPVQTIKGIGSAYAERLGTAGIETVGELADADPAAVASEADVPQARLEDWIERAKAKR